MDGPDLHRSSCLHVSIATTRSAVLGCWDWVRQRCSGSNIALVIEDVVGACRVVEDVSYVVTKLVLSNRVSLIDPKEVLQTQEEAGVPNYWS